jgi:hypothetical protein
VVVENQVLRIGVADVEVRLVNQKDPPMALRPELQSGTCMRFANCDVKCAGRRLVDLTDEQVFDIPSRGSLHRAFDEHLLVSSQREQYTASRCSFELDSNHLVKTFGCALHKRDAGCPQSHSRDCDIQVCARPQQGAGCVMETSAQRERPGNASHSQPSRRRSASDHASCTGQAAGRA